MSVNNNDLEKLRDLQAVIPIPPRKWTINDMKNFLTHIEIPSEVISNFEKHAITGTMFLEYVNEDSIKELTQSIFVIRKLKDWQQLLARYHEFFPERSSVILESSEVKFNVCLVKDFLLLQESDMLESVKNMMRDSMMLKSLPIDPLKFELLASSSMALSKTSSLPESPATGRVKAVLYPLTNNGSSAATFYEKGLTIGRNLKNHLIIEDNKVSRFHASIFFHEECHEFRIQDEGSAWGTYLQVKSSTPLKKNILFSL